MNGIRAGITCRTTTARASILLMAAILLAIGAQAASDTESSDVGKGFGTYDSAQEITVVGTVQEVVDHPAPGSAVGLHLLISTEGKTVDAHLGPFVSRENREALALGQSVEIVGANVNVHGQNVLLARQLVIAGHSVTIRNERGFLVREVHRRATQISKPAANGGAQ
jgi:hypothetical protein